MAANLRSLAHRLGAREIKRLARVQPLIRRHTSLEETEKTLGRRLQKISKRRARVGARIEALLGGGRAAKKRGRPRKAGRKKYRLSAEGRRRIVEATKRRWAKLKATRKQPATVSA